MRRQRLAVKSNNRVAIVGKTGSGKTYFAHFLCRDIKRLVVFDGKGTLNHGWNLTEWNAASYRRLLRGEPIRLRVPMPLDMDWTRYLWAVYKARNVTLYIDETYSVVQHGGMNPALNALVTRGRELNIGVYFATQRPAWIPLALLSEADWFVQFRLQLEKDRKRMVELCGPEVLDNPVDRYGFYLYHTDWNKPIYYNKLGNK